jgi:hypothetical protein
MFRSFFFFSCFFVDCPGLAEAGKANFELVRVFKLCLGLFFFFFFSCFFVDCPGLAEYVSVFCL